MEEALGDPINLMLYNTFFCEKYKVRRAGSSRKLEYENTLSLCTTPSRYVDRVKI